MEFSLAAEERKIVDDFLLYLISKGQTTQMNCAIKKHGYLSNDEQF